MKCETCNIAINAQFNHAISNNQCPACGGKIMQHAKLSAYLSLKTLLENNIKGDVDIDKIATVIVANFDLKQLFNDSENNGSIEVHEEKSKEQEDPDAEHKKIQKKESLKVLQKLREEAFNDAISDHYDEFSDDGIIIGEEDDELFETINKQKNSSLEAIRSGSGGSFSRSE